MQDRSVVYVAHNTLPWNSGGYATRTHGIVSGLAGKRPSLSGKADREIDQAGIVARQFLVTNPEPRGDAGTEAFDQRVGMAEQVGDLLLGVGGFRALKVWLGLRLAGQQGYRRMIESSPVALVNDLAYVEDRSDQREAETYNGLGRGCHQYDDNDERWFGNSCKQVTPV